MSVNNKQIPIRNIELRKAKDSLAQELTFLISNIKTEAKTKNPSNPEITDSLVISNIRSQIKKAKETISLTSGKIDVKHIEDEIKELEKYLPQEVSEQDIRNFVKEIISNSEEKSMKLMGQIMSKLKEKFKDSLNPQMASKITKEELQQ